MSSARYRQRAIIVLLVRAGLFLAAGCDVVEPLHFPENVPATRGTPGFQTPTARIRVTVEALTYARNLAGPGAVNCGRGSDAGSNSRLHDCAARSMAQDLPFYCVYGPRRDVEPSGLPPQRNAYSTIGGIIGGPITRVAYAYRGRRLIVVNADQSGRLTHRLLFNRDEMTPPLRLGGPEMRPPRLRETLTHHSGKERLGGLLIFETIIRPDGTVQDVKTLKGLPMGLDLDGINLMKNAQFTPATFFGMPVPVIFNVTVNVRNGFLTLGPAGAAPPEGGSTPPRT